MMLSLTIMSAMEYMVDQEIREHYGANKNPKWAAWYRLPHAAKAQWCKLFWKEKLD